MSIENLILGSFEKSKNGKEIDIKDNSTLLNCRLDSNFEPQSPMDYIISKYDLGKRLSDEVLDKYKSEYNTTKTDDELILGRKNGDGGSNTKINIGDKCIMLHSGINASSNYEPKYQNRS